MKHQLKKLGLSIDWDKKFLHVTNYINILKFFKLYDKVGIPKNNMLTGIN